LQGEAGARVATRCLAAFSRRLRSNAEPEAFLYIERGGDISPCPRHSVALRYVQLQFFKLLLTAIVSNEVTV